MNVVPSQVLTRSVTITTASKRCTEYRRIVGPARGLGEPFQAPVLLSRWDFLLAEGRTAVALVVGPGKLPGAVPPSFLFLVSSRTLLSMFDIFSLMDTGYKPFRVSDSPWGAYPYMLKPPGLTGLRRVCGITEPHLRPLNLPAGTLAVSSSPSPQNLGTSC